MTTYRNNKKIIMNKADMKDQEIENKDVNTDSKGFEGKDSDESEHLEAVNVSCDSSKSDDTQAAILSELKDWQDRYVRLQADFDNFRKRTLKEKMELIDTAGIGIIKSVLSITDDMDRAVKAAQLTDNVDSIRQGLELITSKLYDVLRQNAVKEIPALGEEFNTDFHDAVAKVPVEDEDTKGKIIDVLEKGYTMKEKIVRFSKVVVGE